MGLFGFSWAELADLHRRFYIRYGNYNVSLDKVAPEDRALLKKILQAAIYIKKHRYHISDKDKKFLDNLIISIKDIGVKI